MRPNPKALYIGLMFFFLTAALGTAQNISGVINTYTNVTAVSGASVTVGSAAGFAVGNKVLIIQMKGATINTANNATFGQITAYGNSGNYEYGTIASIAGNVITLTSPLCQTYTISGAVQLIRVPVYNNPVVNATLTCQAWNGTTGGVLAFDVTGTLTLNANIDVSGLGFRGGGFASSFFSCGDANYATNYAANSGGQKGEGITNYPANLNGNRAPLANGGGGSNTGNPGAGGGSNAGAGGRGGNEWSGCGASVSWGLGGYPLTLVSTKAFLGGGGGGGYRDNGLTATAGSNGGGLVFINAPTIAGNGFSINANGANVTGISDSEGAGGGGAGGAIYIWMTTATSVVNMNTRGGNGGNIFNTLWSSAAHGPGGGGGGGYVWLSTAATPANVVISTTGGTAGLVTHAGAWFNTNYGAVNGSAGSTRYNLPVPAPPLPQVNLGNDTTICAGDTITLNAGSGYPSYLWNNATNLQTLGVSLPGTYWVEVPIGCGATDRDSIVITNYNVSVSLGPDQSFCQGDSAQFDAGPGFSTYTWNTGSSGQSIWATNTGQYWVTVTNANGCTASDTAQVSNVFVITPVNLGPDQNICQGDSALLTAPGYNSYNWSTTQTTSSIYVNGSGTYWVVASDANLCTTTDTVSIAFYPNPVVNLGNDTSLCPGGTVPMDAGPGFNSYTWQDGTNSQTYTASATGQYWVQVVDVNGCDGGDTLQVNFFVQPLANLGPDVSLCAGESITLDPGAFAQYNWWNGGNATTAAVNAAGWYWVAVTDVNGCTDTDSMQVQNVFPNPVISLGPDTAYCFGGSVVLSPGPGFAAYLWQDGSTASSLGASNQGTYHVTVTDNNGCLGSDTMRITGVFPLPAFTLGNDFGICQGESRIISPSGLTVSVTYQWQDNSTGSNFLVADTGLYSLVVVDGNGCAYGDTVHAYTLCPPTLYIPNAFTPNLDGYNPVFQAYGTNIRFFRMDIFNRWGELIHTMENLSDSWNGTYQSEPVPLGMYVYKVTYVDYLDAEEKFIWGNVNVLR